jgi:hypothetical protein
MHDDPAAALTHELEQSRAAVADLEQRLHETAQALDAARRALALALETHHATLRDHAPVDGAQAQIDRLQQALAEMRASEAYRVGRAVTWPARHVKRLLGRS